MEQIGAAILRSWRSFYSAHALTARAAAPAVAGEGMALLIQPLVDAHCAGVCLSVDPVARSAEHLVVSAAWGLGSGVVDGSVPCDSAWVRRDNLRVARHDVVPKPQQVALGDDGRLRLASVPEEQQRAACLPGDWLERIAQFTLAAEQLFGCPQEVEWAIAQEQLWILQSRPLTALPAHVRRSVVFPVAWEDEGERRHLWELTYWSKPAEPPLLPLEQAYARAMEEMRLETCRWLGAERNWTRKWANGRLYARSVPVGLSPADMAVRRAAYEDLQQRWRQEGTTAWDYWGPEIVQAVERLRSFDYETADGPALAQHLEQALAAARRHTMLHPMLTFKPRDSYVAAFAALSGSNEDEARAQATMLVDGEATPLTDLVDRLYELAVSARAQPVVAALVAQPPADVMARLRALPEAAEFMRRLDAFLSHHGERTGHGYGSHANLSTRMWREQPEVVLQMAAPYLDASVPSPAKARAQARRQREVEIEALCAMCTDAEAVTAFRQELAYARRAFAVLEEHNHFVDQMALGQVRRATIAAAGWLAANSILDEQDDVLYLTFVEILDALRADEAASFSAEIDERRARHALWQQMKPPAILGLPEASLDQRPPWHDEVTEADGPTSGEVKGLGASPGRARGRARVVRENGALPALARGDVLVAHNVGPRWTPLFPILGGLVLESGSVGQHAAATAREYGVPAVIGTSDATRRIPDGAWVVVDGGVGVVRVVGGGRETRELEVGD
jgi:pyruvate,water dikinase